jgi:hypothetical protein
MFVVVSGVTTAAEVDDTQKRVEEFTSRFYDFILCESDAERVSASYLTEVYAFVCFPSLGSFVICLHPTSLKGNFSLFYAFFEENREAFR